ncbi:MAG TPA: hypothetical protein VNN25_14050 [Thermoanaerobaculia bacterium]|nr:hypothetical protein [Thermoanaerobaculia bacterium]
MTTGGGARFKRLRTIALAAPVVLIVALHAVMLLRRVGDASITRPVVLAQWAFAAALLAAALFVRRALSRNGGRRAAIIFWLFVAILHLAPAGERYFDLRQDAALLVEVGLVAVPAIVILASRQRSDSIQTQSGWIGIDLLAFAPFSSSVCLGDRAPPRF